MTEVTGAARTAFDYTMPSLGADMDEGSVVEWLVAVGDRVERGQVVARVETEKSDIDIEIWQDGVVDDIVVPTRRVVPVGTVLMRLTTTGEALPAVAPTAPEPSTRSPVRVEGGRPLATPRARRLAEERGLSLVGVVGSGPGGAIRSCDLSDSDAASRPAATRSERMRLAIAERMERSSREIPHYRLERTVDLDALHRHLAEINEHRPVADRLVPAAAFIRAVARAADRHRELNGSWVDGAFRPGPGVNVALAISLRTGGLVTPTIVDAASLSLDETMERVREFTTAARAGSLRSEWMRDDSTITVTNLGERGADLVHGLISPPEVALVGFGRVLERPWVVEGHVVPRQLVQVTLAADHRATDGASGSRFLATLARFLEEPER